SEPDFKDMQIINGNFYADNTPFFLIGPDYGNIEINELDKFGFNYSGVVLPPVNVILGSTMDDYIKRKNEQYYLPAKVAKFLKDAEGKNIMLTVYVSLSADYKKMPQWFYGKDDKKFDINPAKKTDGIGCGSDHSIAFCILNPHTREMLETYYKKIIPELKEYSSVLSYMVTGEIQYKCSPYCPLAENDFRRWLKEKYNGDIEKLNFNWRGPKYKSFEEIKLADSCFGVKVQERYDYLTYNREALSEFFRLVSRVIKDIDPQARVHLRAGGYFDHYYADSIDRKSGIDLEVLNNDVFDIAEVAAPVCDWRHQVFNSDLNQSLAPSRPGLDGEWSFLKRSDSEYTYDNSKPYNISMSPEKYISSRLWESFIHGKDAIGFFMWARELNGERWEVLSRPEELEALGKTALNIRRLCADVVDFHTAPSQVVILYSVTSKLQTNIMDYINELEKVYTGLFFLDTNIKFITERQIERGELGKYKMLVVPRANYIEENAYEKIRKFVYNGGGLFVTNESLALNEYGFKRDIFFSMKNKDVEKFGDGSVYYYNVNFSQTNEKYYNEIFNDLSDEIGIDRPVRVVDNEGHNLWGVETRFVDKSNGRIIYLLNWTDKSAKIKIDGVYAKDKITDLISGRKIDTNSLTLEPLEVLLLKDVKVAEN
ncbi:MAG: beta-galactosidase, partial [Candidatus Omnitrophota bacterium]